MILEDDVGIRYNIEKRNGAKYRSRKSAATRILLGNERTFYEDGWVRIFEVPNDRSE